MPAVKFDFFSVKIDEASPVSFEEALNEMATMATEHRLCDIDGATCFLLESLPLTRYTAYLFTKIRMNEIPSRTNIRGERTVLELDDDEGLGEDVSIAYSRDLNVVSVQRNRYSISANNIMKIVNDIFPELKAQLLPILRSDALERFTRCNMLKKLRLKIAGREDLSFISESNLSANEKLTFHELLTEPYVDISFSVGRKNIALTEKIKNIASFFANYSRTSGTDTVMAVEVSGKEDDSAVTSVIDLLQDRLIHIGNVEMNGRSINTNHLMRVACDAIAQNYQELSGNANS